MKAHAPSTGGCLCGAIRYAVEPNSLRYSVCHCDMCRKFSGAGFMSLVCARDSFKVENDHHLSTYESSGWAERGFCNRCGTPLFYRLKNSDTIGIAVGTFDENEGLVFDLQYYVDERPAHFGFSNKTHDMTGAEMRATYPELAGGESR